MGELVWTTTDFPYEGMVLWGGRGVGGDGVVSMWGCVFVRVLPCSYATIALFTGVRCWSDVVCDEDSIGIGRD